MRDCRATLHFLSASFLCTLAAGVWPYTLNAQTQQLDLAFGELVIGRPADQTENAQLRPPSHQPGDFFGNRLAVSGDVLAVSAPTEGGPSEPTVYIFCRAGTRESNWEFASLITSPDPVPRHFGRALALSGDTLVVGDEVAYTENVPTGAVHVFRRASADCKEWAHSGRLLAPKPRRGMAFGASLAMDNGTLVVGAPWDDEFIGFGGSAFVFQSHPHQQPLRWEFVSKLTATEPQLFAFFGEDLALSGTSLIVGAPDEGSTGASYLFEWKSHQIPGTNPPLRLVPREEVWGGNVGQCVDIEGDTLVVAAPNSYEVGYRAGVVHVYERTNSIPLSWRRTAKIYGNESHASQFGCALDLTKSRLAVAQIYDYNSLNRDGVVNTFRRVTRFDRSVWNKTATLAASDFGWDHFYGNDVLITSDSVLVGAPYADPPGASNGGAVYFFELQEDFADGFESGDTSAWSASVP